MNEKDCVNFKGGSERLTTFDEKARMCIQVRVLRSLIAAVLRHDVTSPRCRLTEAEIEPISIKVM